MNNLQKKLISSGLKKISADKFHLLSGIELYAYAKYRINRFLKTKQLLVRDEIEYLLTETGPGNVRLTPELVELLPLEPFYISTEFENSPQRDLLLAQKLSIEDYIKKNINSTTTQDILFHILSKHIDNPTKNITSPFIINGAYKDIPISCLIKNGGWITPTGELFDFIRNCKSNKRFPILIAKKISGILFPIFKELSILGLNTYKTFLPEEIKPMLEKIRVGQDELSEIKYFNQFLPSHLPQEPTSANELIEDNPLDYFFSTTLKQNITKYNNKFIHSPIAIPSNLTDILSQFKMNNTTKRLIKTLNSQKKLYEEVILNFPPQHKPTQQA